MRNYGQFCPIARGSAILAERWTPIILRNVLLGCRTFNEIAAGAPGLSRALLTRRLRELEHAGVIDIRSKPDGHGSLYEPTPAGRELWPVLNALGGWAERWMEVTAEHAAPDAVLWSWCRSFLRRDLLPNRRVVIRFEFEVLGRSVRSWLLIERREGEVCSFDPGFEEDLVVSVAEPLEFARWHLGLIDWATALGSGGIDVTGPRDLRRALPTWNSGPEIHNLMRAEHKRIPGAGSPPAAWVCRQAARAVDRTELHRSRDHVGRYRLRSGARGVEWRHRPPASVHCTVHVPGRRGGRFAVRP
jgi:DNA-binding HxlR family transcriptional regulator